MCWKASIVPAAKHDPPFELSSLSFCVVLCTRSLSDVKDPFLRSIVSSLNKPSVLLSLPYIPLSLRFLRLIESSPPSQQLVQPKPKTIPLSVPVEKPISATGTTQLQKQSTWIYFRTQRSSRDTLVQAPIEFGRAFMKRTASVPYQKEAT